MLAITEERFERRLAKEIGELRIDMTKEFASLRAEMTKEFASAFKWLAALPGFDDGIVVVRWSGNGSAKESHREFRHPPLSHLSNLALSSLGADTLRRVSTRMRESVAADTN